MQVKIIWQEAPAEANRAAVEKFVLDDLSKSFEEDFDFTDLIFHHVFFDENMEGPSVLVTAGGNSREVVCDYYPHTDWDSIDMDEQTAKNLAGQGVLVEPGMKVRRPKAGKKQ